MGGIRRIIVPVELGYPNNDMNALGPRPLTFSVRVRLCNVTQFLHMAVEPGMQPMLEALKLERTDCAVAWGRASARSTLCCGTRA